MVFEGYFGELFGVDMGWDIFVVGYGVLGVGEYVRVVVGVDDGIESSGGGDEEGMEGKGERLEGWIVGRGGLDIIEVNGEI